MSEPSFYILYSTCSFKAWHTARISRKGKSGSLTLNNRMVDTAETYGEMTDLSVEGPIFIGGWRGDLPFDSLSRTGFVGCVDEVYIGPDAANLEDTVDSLGVTQGCEVKVTLNLDKRTHHLERAQRT